MQVIKRNGNKVEYNPEKIRIAISKANTDLPDEEIQRIYEETLKTVEQYNEISVEEISDIAENVMMRFGHYKMAKKFMLYRYKRELVRKSNTTDESILSLIRQENEEVMNENSNKNGVEISTQRDLIAGIASRDLTVRVLLPEDVAEAHRKGQIHFHDSDYAISPETNCCLVNIGDMLNNGTVMNGKMIERPKSFHVSCTVTSQIVAAIASSQYGGQSVDVSHLSPFLKESEDKFRREYSEDIKDKELVELLVRKRLKKELSAGIQTIQYQLNTLFSTQGQSPFVTLFLYLRKDDPYKKYTAMIIEEILNQRILGIKNEVGVYITPAFPKLVYVLTPENNLSGGEYDYLTHLAARCNAKRIYPDYISEKVMMENTGGYCFSPMGCRSFLSPWYDEGGNVKFEGRFNMGVVSLNLPNVALTSKRDHRDFWEVLDERLAICYKALDFRYKHLLGTKAKVAPILWEHGAIARLNSEDKIDSLLQNGYASISLGYIGLYETCLIMTGEDQTKPHGKEFGLKLMKKLRETCDNWKKETGLGYSLYGTPSESLCNRVCQLDRKEFGVIENVTDKGYYTNTYHVDVRQHIDAFSKILEEAPYQKISSGGCISYVELPNMDKNIEAIETLIKFIYDNIQYCEFNLKSDYCMNCGFDGEIKLNDNNEWECPICHNKDQTKMNVVRRTCGYLGEKYWNVGKTKEIKARVTHL